MMEGSNETKDDIIAEMKRRKEKLEDAVFAAPLCYSTETMRAQSEILDEFIERFEAAHKREKATAEKSSAVGDCAKLREALTKVEKWMERRIVTCGFEFSATIPTMLEDVVLPALAAPPRNCDVGTAKEQESRWETNCGRGIPNCKHCKVYEKAKNSGLVHGRYLMRCDCRFIWAQMPYKEGESSEDK
jgi:hypothetical protein